MNGIDWALLAVLLLSALMGLWRGLVYEVLSLAAWVAAFVLAQIYAAPVGEWLPMDTAAEALRIAAGFVVVFVAAAFAGGWLAWLVSKLVASVGLRPIDRVLGGAFGAARGLVMLLGLCLVVGMTSVKAQPMWQGSVVVHALNRGLLLLKPVLPAAVARHVP